MSVEMGESLLSRYRRKRDQAYEMSALARKDNDKADEARWLAEAKEYERKIGEEIRAS